MRGLEGMGTLLIAIAVAACGGEDTGSGTRPETVDPGPEGPDTGEQGCDAMDLAPPAPGEGMQLAVELELRPGEEREVCQLVLLEEKMNLNRGEGLFSRGSHHGNVFRTTYRDALPTKTITGREIDPAVVHDCLTPAAEWDVTGVVVSGRMEGAENGGFEVNTLPGDVAFRLEAGEVVLLNFHMLNTGDEVARTCYKANLHTIPDEQVVHEAGNFFYFNSFIALPAGGTGRADMACPVQHDVNVSAAISHMHSLGVGYTATLLDGDPLTTGKAIRTLHESTDWEEPIQEHFAPALPFSAGQWIRWSCDFANPGSTNVAQGFQTTDEMCMFVGTYWPRSLEMDFCATHPIVNGQNGRVFGQGTGTAEELLDCLAKSPNVLYGSGPESAEDRYQTHKCVTQTCPKVTARLYEHWRGEVDLRTVSCD